MTVASVVETSNGVGRVLRSAGAVATGTVVSGALGLVFWAVAARCYGPAAVGTDALLLALMQTIAGAADLNLSTSLPRLVPQLAGDRARVIGWSYAACSVTSALFTVAFLVCAPLVSDSFSFLRGDLALQAAVLLGVVGWAVFSLQDSVLVAVRRTAWIPVENIVFGIVKIGLLVGFAMADVPHGILLSWIVAAVLISLPINIIVVPDGIRRFAGSAVLRIRGAAPTQTVLMSFLAYDYAALLVQQVGVLVLPLAVTASLGVAANGLFTICLTCAFAIDTVLIAIGSSLTVEGAAQPERATGLARASARRIGAVLVVAVAAAIAVTPELLRLFGAVYADGVTLPLRLMFAAALPQAVVILWSVLLRLDGRTRPILLTQVAILALLLGLVALGAPRWGIAGIATAWLVAQSVVALAVLPSLAARMRKGCPA